VLKSTRFAVPQEWIVDYGAARAKAIEWLKDRYLLARPINRQFATTCTWRAEGSELNPKCESNRDDSAECIG
jgi:hypothetical protein